jgi:deazaflavin-dependent oxidoreductase (nitroreductase family)
MLIKAVSGANTAIYRVSGGRLGARFFGAPVLLLTTVGRKSGERRTAPLLYLEDGDRIVIVASKGGDPKHPAWYLNLKSDPDVEVEIGKQKRRMRARTANDEERAELWPKLVAMYRHYDTYQRRTDRTIPVVILTDR